nr:hypothetical protein [Tanacetum cinerariifolium]
SVFKGFFEKQKLTDPNFIDWYRQLRIMLSIEDKFNYLEQPIPPVPIAPAVQQEEGQSVSSYILNMKGYIDNLEYLGHPVTLGLGVSLILIGLRKEYDGFVQNYNMHRMGKTINELHAMLKLHEQTLPKSNAPALNAIRAGKVQKGNKYKKSHSQKGAKGQNQGKGKFVPKPKIPPPPKRENPANDSICHEAGGSGIFVIELNNILNRSWIYDTGCGTHICNTTQGLRASRKIKPLALCLYVGNGQREAVEAIGAFYLCLPNGLEIVLNNWHYAPSITRGVISVSRLYEDGFVNRFVDNTIQVSRNNVVYFYAIPTDGIFEIDLSNSLTNESFVYAVSNKRAKLNLDSALCGIVDLDILALVMRDTLTKPDKLEPRAIKCIFVGYPKETIRYSFYYPPENKVLVARNAEFLENIQEDTHPSLDTSLNHEEEDLEIDEPQNSESEKWLNAMNVEMQSMKDNEVWVLVELPPNGKTVGSKWLFKKKTDMDLWIQKLENGLVKSSLDMRIQTSSGAIAIANESGITKGARRFRIKVHYLREARKYVENGCELFLAQVTGTVPKEKRVEDVLVVRDFPEVMSTPACVDSKTITQANSAQSSRVSILLSDDPYVAVRQAQLVDTDTESDPEETPSEGEESQPLGSRVLLMSEKFEASEPSSTRTILSHSLVSSDTTAPLSPDHPLTHASPTPTPTRVLFHRRAARMAVCTQPTLSPGKSSRIVEAAALSLSSFRKKYRSSYKTLSPSSSTTLSGRRILRRIRRMRVWMRMTRESQGLDDEGQGLDDEGQGLDDEGQGLDDKGQGLDEEGQGLEDEGPGLQEKEEEAALEARHRALESTEEIAPSTYECTLVSWVDPEGGRVYTDIPTYAPPAAPVQTPPSPEWSLGSLPASPSSPIVPSPIALPVATTATTLSIDKDKFLEDSGFELTGFSDADYAGCKDSFKSTSGGAQFLGEKLLTDYGFHFDKIPIYCDSKSAIAISCNPVQHSRTKHIVVRYHFIKEHVEKGMIELYFVKRDYQLANIFTKALPADRFNYLVRRLGADNRPQMLEKDMYDSWKSRMELYMLNRADNRPPMLEKDMYDSWKSRMELYMLNRPNGRMILESVEQVQTNEPTNSGTTVVKVPKELPKVSM